MKAMLLAVNPEHVKNMFNGKKGFEYRKVACKQDVGHIVIYCTSPVKKVVGEAIIQEVIEDTPDRVWERTCDKAGISREFFNQYYNGKKTAVAYKLTEVTPYDEAIPLETFGVHCAPQSFVYVDI